MKMKSTTLLLALGMLASVRSDLNITCSLPNYDLLYLDYAHDNPSCVKLDLYRGKVTWYQAQYNCQADGTGVILAEPCGHLHHEIVQDINDRGLSSDDFWIGGSDAGSEGDWRWLSDSSSMPMGAPHWYPCSPNAQPDNKTSENCACLLHSSGYYFSDCECEQSTMYAICQMTQGL